MTGRVGTPVTVPAAVEARVELAARRLFDAETALHAAHQSHVDLWIDAASERLHDAISAYEGARTA